MMIYAVVAALNLVACCYLLFRRGNAFAPDITSPVRLRRWTAVFFAAMTISHLWYMPSIYLTSSEDKMLCYDIGGILDCMTTFPLAIVILFTMLQDRRRPLWLAWVMVATTTTIPPSADPKFFGPASYHEDDYPFFYNNIKDNVAKRIATYKANQ